MIEFVGTQPSARLQQLVGDNATATKAHPIAAATGDNATATKAHPIATVTIPNVVRPYHDNPNQ